LNFTDCPELPVERQGNRQTTNYGESRASIVHMGVREFSMISEATFNKEVDRQKTVNESFSNCLLSMKLVVLFEGSLVFVVSENSGVVVSEYFVASSDVVSIFLSLSELLFSHFTY
jgi:hypothetical protein